MSIGLVLDVIILCFLGVTIFYASRLSSRLKEFRASRADFEPLFEELSQHIGNAQTTIEKMHCGAETSGTKLQDIMNEAKFIADELRFMNETGDNLASRLEAIAQRTNEKAGLSNFTDKTEYIEDERSLEPQRAESQNNQERNEDRFAIQDRDFLDEVSENMEDDVFYEQQTANISVKEPDVRLGSQAERDLYEALNKGGAQRRPQKKKQSDGIR